VQMPVWVVIGAAGLVAVTLLATWMVFIEPRLFRVVRIEIPTADPDTELVAVGDERLAGLKILHVSDTHFHGRDEGKLRFLRRVASEEFDLVFLTGDLIDSTGGIASCVRAARGFRARLGVFAVLGGHDYCRPDLLARYLGLASGHLRAPWESRGNRVDLLVKGLYGAGVEVLSDEHRMIRLAGGGEAAIVGLRDAFTFVPHYDAAWRGIADGVPVIVLAHSPDVLPEVVRRGAKLAFFGHTHGGQVRLPFVGAVVTRCSLAASRARGTFREKGTIYTLNDGLGAGRGISFRLLCRPEVAVVRLTGG